ncbi:ATP-binding cassette domain-containing protein [Herbidospora sp. NEAU-GS84]|uniref:ATP-binding cassette domain-containing protein n=1 Tax=Herbidospora solisilvae TaxID=2696284 RepID=A0A7C9J9V4_9ACTN|nr:ATP-binding cassette domain-containing protein [Herbidospora solisilvae]NAS24008.1 ATP-binding cassette domain-containing protein [Herbidospora solisilvae]
MRATNVSFRYRRGDPWVLSDASLDLAPGSVAEITGPNGTGKSTLLRLLAGLLRPVRGRIEERPAVIGYAPERFPSAQPFTVAAYLRHMAAVRRVAVPEELTARLGMDHLLGQKLPDLSKGSAHKVGLAQALAGEPGLLILDEPFAGLDATARAELSVIVAEVAARGGIVVASDHQGDLRSVPGVTRYEVRDGKIAEAVPIVVDDPLTTLTIKLPQSKADALAARLRAEGHEVS